MTQATIKETVDALAPLVAVFIMGIGACRYHLLNRELKKSVKGLQDAMKDYQSAAKDLSGKFAKDLGAKLNAEVQDLGGGVFAVKGKGPAPDPDTVN